MLDMLYFINIYIKTCGPNWPYGGEIDVLEGVHDNEHNQVTWHTGPGCNLTPTNNFTGNLVVGHFIVRTYNCISYNCLGRT